MYNYPHKKLMNHCPERFTLLPSLVMSEISCGSETVPIVFVRLKLSLTFFLHRNVNLIFYRQTTRRALAGLDHFELDQWWTYVCMDGLCVCVGGLTVTCTSL